MYIETFAQRIKKARIDANLTQKDVERITKITQSTISKYEKGKIEPNIEVLGTLIDLYDIEASFIIGTKN